MTTLEAILKYLRYKDIYPLGAALLEIERCVLYLSINNKYDSKVQIALQKSFQLDVRLTFSTNHFLTAIHHCKVIESYIAQRDMLNVYI
jgi:hypothetical protein